MKKFFLAAGLIFIFFSALPLFLGKIEAAFLKFDKTSVTVNPNETFQIAVVVDAGSEQITSTDAYIIFDASLLEAQSVADGSFFSTVVNDIKSGKVYLAGLVDDPATYKTGSGTIGTITFKALKDGSTNLSFDCSLNVSSSSKIIKNDLNATNVIVCSQNGSVPITSGVGGAQPTPTPTSGSGGGGNSGGGSQTPPKSLPKSGVFDEVVKLAVPGTILFLVGGALRLLL